MRRREHEPRALVYPSPTVVVGVGRLGLAVLERLGEDWYDLSRAGADPSLQNLRLIHVAAEREDDPRWRHEDRKTARVAEYVGDSDLPSLALDLAILRSLGLVRYRDGSYQVATPRDGGVVDQGESRLAPPEPEFAGSGDEDRHTPLGSSRSEPSEEDSEARSQQSTNGEDAGFQNNLQRRRYFAWHELSPDPVVAAERLKRLTDRDSELDLFVTPILNRVRQGHSPRTILATIARTSALRDGRDPSPWRWLWTPVDDPEGPCPVETWASNVEHQPLEVRFTAASGDRARAVRLLGLEPDLVPTFVLEDLVPPPLPGWQGWLRAAGFGSPRFHESEGVGSSRPRHEPILFLRVPAPLAPHPSDMPSWLQPSLLLRQDWANTGWVTDVTLHDAPFNIVEASPFRLGLFDHDGSGSSVLHARLAQRLQDLGNFAHQGLVRLWVDLQRERVEERQPVLLNRRREHDEDALRQTLEILGELLVRQFVDAEEEDPQEEPRSDSPASRAPESPLPKVASRFLSSIELQHDEGGASTDLLARRLATLGLEDAAEAKEPIRLLRQVWLGSEKGSGLPRLRRLLNREVRRLFNVDTLTAYRDWPTRRPPRLSVFLVGDMGEPFVRAAMRMLLRESHAELLRAFGPILEYFREGFDRGLSVTPILWMPHPADPFEGGGDEACRCEEAAIINAVHSIRRWVESVIPSTRRRVSQIFVNSRVSDVAVLDVEDAARQTRDFLTLQIRNDLSRDEWLRRTAEGPAGDDFFSSFTCYAVEFPAEKAREYLANRLGRDALRRLKSLRSDHDEAELEPPAWLLHPPRLDDGVSEARTRLGDTIRQAAEEASAPVLQRGGEIGTATPLGDIEKQFDRDFEDQLLRTIQESWKSLSRSRGEMDALVDRLRMRTSEMLTERVDEVRRHGDRLIEFYAGRGGVQTAIAGFNVLREKAWHALERSDRHRSTCEDVARRHTVPATDRVAEARTHLLEVARRRPDAGPIRFGLLLWLLLAPVLGAPLGHAVAYLFGLHLQPNRLEPLLGPHGWLTGGLLVALAGWAGIRGYQMRLHRHLTAAIDRLASTVRTVLEGGGLEPSKEQVPSVRSFLEARLLLAQGLAARGFSLQVFERVEGDHHLASRLNRSIDVQSLHLARQAEDLGVRPTLGAGPEGALARYPERDDVSHLFSPRSGEAGEHLIAPQRLVDLYRRRLGDAGEEVEKLLPRILADAGGFSDWRQSACLSDGEAILAVGRHEFGQLVDTPLPAQHRLADEVGRRLCRFVSRFYPNMGFGARFTGYEGLDPDGIFVSADASLLLHPSLKVIFEQARIRDDASATTATMKVLAMPVGRSSAYMLSLAQGIRAHSVRNLKRFESFHGRPHMPEDRTFPISGELEGLDSMNLLTEFRDVAEDLHRQFNGSARRSSVKSAGRAGREVDDE